MDFFVLELKNVDDAGEAWLSSRAFDFGALGVSEALGFRQPEGEEDVYVNLAGRRNLDLYFSDQPPAEFLNEVKSHFPSVHVGVKGEKNRDWLAEWKKGFKPFALAGEHWVVPSWCDSPVGPSHTIRIDPGMAFGTGTHETTQLVAQELVEIPVAESLLDVGTGTGILAMLARQRGYKKVCATEIEADSRRVAHENFSLNQLVVRLDERQIEQLNETFDVVVANIIDGVLVRVQKDLLRLVQPGGWLVVSGIITEREQDFLNGFHLPQGRTWRRRQQGDWLLFSVQL